MKSKTVSGAAIAATAVSLILAGAVTASAEDKPKTANKPQAEKMACSPNGCGMKPAKASKDSDGKAAASGEHKSGEK